MKILPVSDVHMEFGVNAEHFVGSLGDADVCVIAGDLCLGRFMSQVAGNLRPFSERYEQVIYVPGNHEYYSGKVHEVDNCLEVACREFRNVHLLRPGSPLVYKGQRFIGGTMWFPDGPENWLGRQLVNDFDMIQNFVPWVYQQNSIFRGMLKNELSPDAVVISHHLPSEKSVARQYLGQKSNLFFVSNQEADISIQQPKLWIHGHTHEPCDYRLGDTRVVCNPGGYPYEKKPFNPNMIVEI